MTGGQTSMAFAMEGDNNSNKVKQQFSALYVRQVSYALFLRQMTSLAHEARLDLVQKKGGSCLWRA